MDRAEQTGLGIAIVGHAALFAALSLSLLAKPEPFAPVNPPMAVELIAETAPISTAPDAVPDASPPPRATAPVAVAQPPMPIATPNKPKPVVMTPPPKLLKPAIESKRPAPTKTTPAKATPTSQTNRPKSKFELPMRDLSASARREASQATERTGTGKGQSKVGSGTPAVKTAAEVRRDIRVSLAAEIFPYWKKCVPNGVDITLIETQLDLKINPDGTLAGVSDVAQTGVNDSNRAQQQRHKECAIKAARLASPFKLDPVDYDIWKTWPMTFKATERK